MEIVITCFCRVLSVIIHSCVILRAAGMKESALHTYTLTVEKWSFPVSENSVFSEAS